MSSKNVAARLKSMVKIIAEYLQPYVTALNNTVIITATGGIQQITTLAAYRCPCVEPAQLGKGCSNATLGSASCSQLLNIGYGLSLLLAPAVILYVLGVGLSLRFWKSVTGFRNKTEKHVEMRDFFSNVCLTLLKATIYPVAWTTVALLDGRFLACALTSLPYETSQAGCQQVTVGEEFQKSKAFEKNLTFSQTVGWIFAAASAFFGFLIYVCNSYTSPLTYYHGQYYKYYRCQEKAAFKEALKKDAQQQAQENVNRFVESTRDERSKALWDKISTVYEFHREKENLDVYSNLHDWAKCQRFREKNLVNGNENGEQQRNDNLRTNGGNVLGNGIQTTCV